MNYITYSIITLLCFGMCNFLLAIAGAKNLNSNYTIFIIMITGTIISTTTLIATKTKIELDKRTTIAILAGTALSIGMLTIKLALSQKNSNPGIVTAIANGNALIVAILSFAFLNKTLNVKQAGGIGFIITGIIILSLM